MSLHRASQDPCSPAYNNATLKVATAGHHKHRRHQLKEDRRSRMRPVRFSSSSAVCRGSCGPAGQLTRLHTPDHNMPNGHVKVAHALMSAGAVITDHPNLYAACQVGHIRVTQTQLSAAARLGFYLT